MLTNEHQRVKDFEEMSVSSFKISCDGEICRHEKDKGEYEFYKKQKDSENYFQIDTANNEIERKRILGRKHKRRVIKVIGTLVVEAGIETENL